jgi:hypothetical protein
MSSTTLEQSRASLALRQSPIPAVRKLSLEETDGMVVLLGKVSSYYQKQLAQEALMPVLGGRQLLNRVVVVREVASLKSEGCANS